MSAEHGVLTEMLDDLRDEGDFLEGIVADLDEHAYGLPTACDGWTIAHQLAHLAWTDEQLLLALEDPDRFRGTATVQEAGFVDRAADRGAAQGGKFSFARWNEGRGRVLEALRAREDSTERVPWFGPSMSAASAATARLMETWAHGHDISDAVGEAPSDTPRLRHVAHLAIRARDYSFSINHLDPPRSPFRVDIASPDGGQWSWGPGDAADRVSGTALDFALLATRRISRDRSSTRASGPEANRWLDVIQAYASAR